jgi:hypothetical protein
MSKFRGLRRQMAGNLSVEPAMELCGQIQDLGSHGEVVLLKSQTRGKSANEPS